MSRIRAQQKEKTRRLLIDAAFAQLSAERSFSNLSLREVTKAAGLSPNSFYRHFSDMEELGLILIDEAGLMLKQLRSQARLRINKGGSAVKISVLTFMEFIEQYANIFRLLLQERAGVSAAFRAALSREIDSFTMVLCGYLQQANKLNAEVAYLQANAAITIVFSAGAEALDVDQKRRDDLTKRTILQLQMIDKGSLEMNSYQTD
ncbi:MAG: AcrR family transcriptional regulator [Psychromonas sp.]|jgi:AcrR family transcriptional regulator|uniref:HTH-type transcriptional repressor FabR n=1 Tax=Psychromonas sp. TaxID=1884585 RepID=UPI0039E5C7C4